ncbi:MAG: hypothetical protein ACOZD0_05650 [Pseudomonadota bacterium]
MKPRFDIYAGLSGLELTEESFDLGEGVTLSRTYAHLMAPFMMAFKKPAEYDQPHPGPWKSLGGGFYFDIDAEVCIPAALEDRYGSQMEIARIIGVLLRLGVHPSLRIPAFANHPFATMGERPERESWLRPNEFLPRYFPLDTETDAIGPGEAAWVAERWPTAQPTWNRPVRPDTIYSAALPSSTTSALRQPMASRNTSRKTFWRRSLCLAGSCKRSWTIAPYRAKSCWSANCSGPDSPRSVDADALASWRVSARACRGHADRRAHDLLTDGEPLGHLVYAQVSFVGQQADCA